MKKPRSKKEHSFFRGKRSDEWRTPAPLFALIAAEWKIGFDLAASPKNKKADKFFSRKHNALVVPWNRGVVNWLNPPFSKAKEFYKKCAEEALRGVKIVSIYKAANPETEIWQDLIFPSANWVCFIRGRVNYDEANGKPSEAVPFGSALIGYNLSAPPQDLFGKVIVFNRTAKSCNSK